MNLTQLHRRRRLLAGFLVVCFLLGALLLGARPADAHGFILRAIPANGAVLERSPGRIQAWFSEGLEPRFSSLSLADERGNPFPLVDSGVVQTNTALLSARIPEPLPNGVYVVSMRVAFASDGHVFNERLIFWVGEPAGDVNLGANAREAEPLEVLWRVITLPALSLLFGTPLLYGLVLLPGWGNAAYRAGRLAPRVMARLRLVMWGALIAALGGTLLAVLQQTATLFATDPISVVRDGLWQIVLNGTQIGDTLRFRLMFIALAGATHFAGGYFASRLPDIVTPLWWMNCLAGALALGTVSISSHAVGSDLWPLPSILVHWLHTLAQAAWIGGLAALAFLLPVALAPLVRDDRRSAMLAVLGRFSVVGVVCVGLLVATGIYNSALQIRQPADISNTNYGGTLLAKVLLVAPLLLIGLYHHLGVSHALRRSDRLVHLLSGVTRQYRLADRVVTRLASLRLEALLGLGVLALAALLASTPPPIPPTAASGPETSTPIQVGDLAVQFALDPGAAGTNTYEATLTRDGQPVSGAAVTVQFSYPSLDRRIARLSLDEAGDGLYIGAGPQLDRAGAWQVWIDVTIGEAVPVRFALPLDLPAIAPSLTARVPSILNWLGVILIGGALLAWIGPVTVRRGRRLNLKRESLLLGGAAFAVTIIALVVGGFVVAESGAQIDRRRNPTPRVVNSVLADAESLARGRAAFEATCAACHSGRDLITFRYLLDGRRDEAIYASITDGLPTVEGGHRFALDEQTRWDVINYLRSAEFAGR